MLWPWPTATAVSGKPLQGLLLCLLVRDRNPEWRKITTQAQLKYSQDLGSRRAIRSHSLSTSAPCTLHHPFTLAPGAGTCTSLRHQFQPCVTARQMHLSLSGLFPSMQLHILIHSFPSPFFAKLTKRELFQTFICRHFSHPLSHLLLLYHLLPYDIYSEIVTTGTRYTFTVGNHVPYSSLTMQARIMFSALLTTYWAIGAHQGFQETALHLLAGARVPCSYTLPSFALGFYSNAFCFGKPGVPGIQTCADKPSMIHLYAKLCACH